MTKALGIGHWASGMGHWLPHLPISSSPHLPLSPSPHHPIPSSSPHLPLSPSPHPLNISLKFAPKPQPTAEGVRAREWPSAKS
ncbi:MAG: hypothetical protein EAZ09_09945 [Oscillatoriales cyanobacterium]|nr:MAG: hypothetical protein EAZ18_09175 [Oscillatoriales cyanobacterium]TAH22593.1 MAG: hypothetical protein EAZ09_09945 [Oscillatoriales cyanobacterium]